MRVPYLLQHNLDGFKKLAEAHPTPQLRTLSLFVLHEANCESRPNRIDRGNGQLPVLRSPLARHRQSDSKTNRNFENPRQCSIQFYTSNFVKFGTTALE